MKTKINLILLTFIFFFNVYGIYAVEKKEIKENISSNTTNSEYLSNEIKNIENPEIPHGPGILNTSVNLLLSLLFIIGLIYLTIIALKYFYGKSMLLFKSQGLIKIIAREYIDSKKIIYLIDVANKILIVGSGNNELVLLSEINDKETVENIRQQADEYIAKYRLKKEVKFSDNLKSTYIKQGKKLIDSGNETIKKIFEKIRKKQ
ncbi:MAG: flagellar biosynthetic protein FliO [Candidatus Goldbacteria bacterium]|nr:flagellar biosynthetic protein FliO [Candidatus Goldiibacteriota bacterium]